MESDPENSENLNAAFRAAHTIKGTSGLFGCDAVVSFTHDAETLMESLRSGALKVNEAVIAALLQSRDQIETPCSTKSSRGRAIPQWRHSA